MNAGIVLCIKIFSLFFNTNLAKEGENDFIKQIETAKYQNSTIAMDFSSNFQENMNLEKNGNQVKDSKTTDPKANYKKSNKKTKRSTQTDNKNGEHRTAAYRLINALLTGYNKHIRPVKEPGEVTHVFVELSLFDVLSLDTKQQVLKTNTEFIMKWMDVHLKWNPEEFENISLIRIPYYDIWLPDIILYNTAEGNYEDGILYTNAIIKYNGEVEIVSHSIFTSICNVDTQWYPFDQQECKMTFASWTYDEMEIQLILGPADVSEYQMNPEYFMEDFYGIQLQTFNPCCEHLMSTVVFHLQLQRRTIFSLFFYLVPGILINFCAVMVFSIPAESGEKIGLGINSMLAMIVFLMAMTQKLPPTQKIPLAGLYYGVCLVLITLNIACSVFILNMNVSGERNRPIHPILKKIILFLVKCLGNRIPKSVHEDWNLNENNEIMDGYKIDFKIRLEKANEKHEYGGRIPKKDNFSNMKDTFQRRTVYALEKMCELTARKQNDVQKTREKESLIIQWKFMSRVIDRFLFLIFSVTTFFLSALILTSSPFGEKFEYCPLGHGQCEGMTVEEIFQLAKKLAHQVSEH